MIMHNSLDVAGLNATELRRLNHSVLPFIRQSVISLIPPECLAVSRSAFFSVQCVVLHCFSHRNCSIQ